MAPVRRFIVNGPTPQLAPRSNPPAVPVMLSLSDMDSVETPVIGLIV